MPLFVRGPGVPAGSAVENLVLNNDLAPTFAELGGLEGFEADGRSLVPLLRGETPPDWRGSMYYRYWMHRDGAHAVPAHYGVRTRTHKLICYYNDPLGQEGARGPADPVEWELFDLVIDPLETTNVIADGHYDAVRAELEAELARLQAELGDTPHPAAVGA